MLGPWLLDNVSSSTWYYAVRAYAFFYSSIGPMAIQNWLLRSSGDLRLPTVRSRFDDESYSSAAFEWQFSLWLSLVEQKGFWPSHYGNLTFKSTSSYAVLPIRDPPPIFRALTHTDCTVLCTTTQIQSTFKIKKRNKKQNEAFILFCSDITRKNAFEFFINFNCQMWKNHFRTDVLNS